MLYYLNNTCKTCEHARYKFRTCRRRTLVAYRKLRYFLITPKLQKLFMSSKIIKHMTWNYSHDVVDGVMVKPRNILIGCIINFQWNHGTYVLSYVKQIQSIWVICCIIFVLASDTHDLQLTTNDMYTRQ
jgi:hypothetical protein